jgi:Arc/MetJ-type ribon-helix-helix transcriptional regulator
MASKSSSTPAPLTFDLDEALATKIDACRDNLGLSSTSEVVRLAISKFNFDRYKSPTKEHRQVSVRLAGDMRSMLKRQAKVKNASIGELLRVAIDALSSSAPAKKAKPAAKAAKKSGKK